MCMLVIERLLHNATSNRKLCLVMKETLLIIKSSIHLGILLPAAFICTAVNGGGNLLLIVFEYRKL